MFIITCDWFNHLEIHPLKKEIDNKQTVCLLYYENQLMSLSGLNTGKFYHVMSKRFDAIHMNNGSFSYLVFENENTARNALDWLESIKVCKELNK